MNSLYEQVEEVIQMLEKTSNSFYRQQNQDGFQSLDKTLQLLMQLITEISAYKTDGIMDATNENRLNMLLGQAMSAIEKKDMILLSDLFTFELKPLLKQLKLNEASDTK
jgi:hypothetical protein